MTDSSHDEDIFGNPLEYNDKQEAGEEEDDHDASEDDRGSDSETKDVQKGNYDDDDEDDDNDDNYDDANPWVELTDQVQESLSELFDEQVQLIDNRENPISVPRMLLSIPSYLKLDVN